MWSIWFVLAQINCKTRSQSQVSRLGCETVRCNSLDNLCSSALRQQRSNFVNPCVARFYLPISEVVVGTVSGQSLKLCIVCIETHSLHFSDLTFHFNLTDFHVLDALSLVSCGTSGGTSTLCSVLVVLTLCPWPPEPLDPTTCTVGTGVPATPAVCLFFDRSSAPSLFSNSYPLEETFNFAGHLHPSSTFRFDRDTRRCEHVALKFLSLCLHMLDIVLSARTFPHLSWSHRILSLECLSLEFAWFGCRRPHLHLLLMQALKTPHRIWLVSLVLLLVELRLWP